MELKIKTLHIDNFKSFIKKLLAIDKFIFIKISPTKIVSSVFFPQKDAVKLVSLDLDSVFEFEDPLEETIKVSFFNGAKIYSALSYFKGKVSAIIKVDESHDIPIVTEFTVYNDDLKISLFVGDPNLSFMEMSSDNIQKAFDIASEDYRFDLSKDTVDQFKSLFQINKENDTFKFMLDDTTLKVKEENYEATVTNDVELKDKSKTDKRQVTIYKKYISILDKENYSAVVCSNKVFLRSTESDTLMTFALCSGLDD